MFTEKQWYTKKYGYAEWSFKHTRSLSHAEWVSR